MWGDSEGDYLNDQSDWGAEDDFNELNEERYYTFINECVDRYNRADRAETGATIECPWCKKYIVKRTYHKKFCSNGKQGAKNCKDLYWNNIDPKRRNRAKVYSGG